MHPEPQEGYLYRGISDVLQTKARPNLARLRLCSNAGDCGSYQSHSKALVIRCGCWPADAMKGLGDELSGTDCSHLLEAMDIHGSITEEDFLAIVEVGGTL